MKFFLILLCGCAPMISTVVHSTGDFEVNGSGSNEAWARAEWQPMRRKTPEGPAYDTKFKILYSKSGLYVLMDATDAAPKATLTLVPGVNHVLKSVEADPASNMASYRDPSIPVAPAVVDAIAGFVKGG